MADEDNTSSPEDTGGTTRNKVAKKKVAKKKVAKKKVAADVAASADAVSEASGEAATAAPVDTPSAAPAEAAPIPQAGNPQAGNVDPSVFGGDEDSSMSGWLVMWGPLIIMGFLILVFMGGERGPETMAAAPRDSAPSPALVPAPTQPRLDISPERAAADLAEAFKAAGIPLPGDVRESAPARVPAPALPADLQANPWAPAPGQAAAMPPPPPPGYGYGRPMPPPGYGYGYPMLPSGPPPGYGYGAPPQQGYGWGAPQGYGTPQMGRPGMGYGAPGYPMHQGMPHGMPHRGMPHRGMPGYNAEQPTPPPSKSKSK